MDLRSTVHLFWEEEKNHFYRAPTFLLVFQISFNSPGNHGIFKIETQQFREFRSLTHITQPVRSGAGFELWTVLAPSSIKLAFLLWGQNENDAREMLPPKGCSSDAWVFAPKKEALAPGPRVYRSGIPHTREPNAEPRAGWRARPSLDGTTVNAAEILQGKAKTFQRYNHSHFLLAGANSFWLSIWIGFSFP